MLGKLARDHKVDVLMMSGDYTAHDVAADSHDPKVIAWHDTIVKDIYNYLFESFIKNYFGKTAWVIPAFGNNDYKTHWGYPRTEEEKLDFYAFSFKKFFEDQPKNFASP